MRRVSDRKTHCILKVLSAFAAFVMTAVCFLSLGKDVKVNADSEVVLSAVTKSTDIGPGDLLIVNIVADNFPGITEFGPVIFNFDADKAEFVSFEQGKDLANYVFTETQNDGVLTVTGMDHLDTYIISQSSISICCV